MYFTVPVFASNSFYQQKEDNNPLSESGSSLSYTNNTYFRDTLLPDFQRRKSNKISILRAVVVFLNQNIGVGLLSIPYCFQTGIVLNSIVLAILAFFALSSFILLVDVSITTGKSIDYAKFMIEAFPDSKIRYDRIPLIIISITLLGCSILHFQYACTLIQTFFDELVDYGVAKIPNWLYNRWFLVGIPALIIDLPLMFLRSIKALSYASLFTLVLITIYFIHSIYIFTLTITKKNSTSTTSNRTFSEPILFDVTNNLNHKFEGITLFSFNKYFIPSLSIQAFAFTFNMMVTPTIEKLKNPNRKNQYTTFACVIGISCITYIICGVLPYLALVPNIKHAIVFEDFVHGRIFTVMVKALFGIFLIMTTPLILFSCRVALNDATFGSEFTTLRWNLMGILVLVVTVVIAAAVESITTVFDFIGGVASTLTAYVLPSLYYLRICRNESVWKKVLSCVLMPSGLVIMCVCLYDSIRSIVKGDADK